MGDKRGMDASGIFQIVFSTPYGYSLETSSDGKSSIKTVSLGCFHNAVENWTVDTRTSRTTECTEWYQLAATVSLLRVHSDGWIPFE